jgi:integrase
MAIIEAVGPYVTRHAWAMIQLQLLTGARPGEIVSMRVGDLNAGGAIWEYTPRSHKGEHHGQSRLILIGPKAQDVLREFLKPNVEAFVFSPIEADAERQAARRESRKSPMTPFAGGSATKSRWPASTEGPLQRGRLSTGNFPSLRARGRP